MRIITRQKRLMLVYISIFERFDDNIIVFSDEIRQSIYWQCDIYNISLKNNRLRKLLDTFRENMIFYSDDLTGTDFKQAINFSIRK
jgi:hypothetical protein